MPKRSRARKYEYIRPTSQSVISWHENLITTTNLGLSIVNLYSSRGLKNIKFFYKYEENDVASTTLKSEIEMYEYISIVYGSLFTACVRYFSGSCNICNVAQGKEESEKCYLRWDIFYYSRAHASIPNFSI